jgi:hypothetical protein
MAMDLVDGVYFMSLALSVARVKTCRMRQWLSFQSYGKAPLMVTVVFMMSQT